MSHQPAAHASGGEGRPNSRPGATPQDIPSTPVSLGAIRRLFTPYRARLGGLLALIFLSAGLGVINPFLLREFIDMAYPNTTRSW